MLLWSFYPWYPMPRDLERSLLLHSDVTFMHRTGQFGWNKMKQFITSWSEIRVSERKYRWLLFFQSALTMCRCRLKRKLRQSHNQATPSFHHPSAFTLRPPLTHLGAPVDGRDQFPSLALFHALLGVDLGELIKRHTKLSPSAFQLGFWRLESRLLL